MFVIQILLLGSFFNLLRCINSLGNLTVEQQTWLLNISRENPFTTWPNASQSQLNHLSYKEQLFNNLTLLYHFPYNHTVDILFSSENQTSNKLVEYQDTGDSACWSGHYLVALSHKYNVTREITTLQRIVAIIDGFYDLIHCTKDSNVLTRFVGATDDSAYKLYYTGYKHHYQCDNKLFDNYANNTWLGGVSRDQYLGTAIGFVSFFTRVLTCDNDDDGIYGIDSNKMNNYGYHSRIKGRVAENSCMGIINETRTKAINLMELLIDNLYNNNWFIIDATPDIQVPTNPTPMFIAVWMRIALSINPNKYNSLFNDDYYNVWLKRSLLDREMDIGSMYMNSYFGNNLCIISVASLGLLETDYDSKIEIFEHLKHIAVGNDGRKQLQATFAAFYISAMKSNGVAVNLTNINGNLYKDSDYDYDYDYDKYVLEQEEEMNIIRGLLQGLLIDFPENKWAKIVDQTTNPLYFPHKSNEYSEYALLPSDRPYDTYMWQRTPAALIGGTDEPIEYQMTDFLLPYWIAKYAQII